MENSPKNSAPLVELRLAVLKTLKYFDLQDHPLTLIEISKYLFKINNFQAPDPFETPPLSNSPQSPQPSASLKEISDALDEMPEVETENGFYFLKGRRQIAAERLHNNYGAAKRFKRSRRFLPLARHIPFVSAAALSGSEAMGNSAEGSDIDLLILTKPGRIWLARLFAAGYFQMLGMRRHGKKIADRFCLNHYVSENKYLDSDRNLYTAIEYVSLIPFFGGREVLEFQKKNLPWISKYLRQPPLALYDTPSPSVLKKFLEFILGGFVGGALEWLARAFQIRKIKLQPGIIVSPSELSFHPESKGQRILSRFAAPALDSHVLNSHASDSHPSDGRGSRENARGR